MKHDIQAQVLIGMRDEELAALVGLAKDRSKAEAHLRKIRALERSIFTAAPGSGEYMEKASPIGAVLVFLEDRGRAATLKEIQDGIVDTGWGGGGEKARKRIKQSITKLTTGRLKDNETLKVKNGLIGLHSWPNERFVTEKAE
jgi:hypothetical protein